MKKLIVILFLFCSTFTSAQIYNISRYPKVFQIHFLGEPIGFHGSVGDIELFVISGINKFKQDFLDLMKEHKLKLYTRKSEVLKKICIKNNLNPYDCFGGYLK